WRCALRLPRCDPQAQRVLEHQRDRSRAERAARGGCRMRVTVDQDQALIDDVRVIAEEVSAKNADSVDRDARFPEETIAALREKQALSAFVPRELGGAGVSFEALAAACYELGRRCGASAMVFAMHQIQVAT